MEKTVTSWPAAASLTARSSAMSGRIPAMMKSSVPMTNVTNIRETSQPARVGVLVVVV